MLDLGQKGLKLCSSYPLENTVRINGSVFIVFFFLP